MSPRELFFRLGAAAILGSLIGIDRQRLDKAAGLRTHMLVSVGSALVMIVSAYGFDDVLKEGRITLDPSRIAAQVVSGIGFLGAGAILRKGRSVHGLTTAASIWAVAAVGLAAGAGLYLASASTTLLILIILAALKPIEDHLLRHDRRRTLTIVADQILPLSEIESQIRNGGLLMNKLKVRPGRMLGSHRFEISIDRTSDSKMAALVNTLKKVEGVREVGYG